MMKTELAEKLDKLSECLPFFRLVNFKDEEHNKLLLDWFADNGEIRAYKDSSSKKFGPSFKIIFCKKGIQLTLGYISSSDFSEPSEPQKTRYEYLKYFWQKNKNLSYCTNICLETRKEIQTREGVIKYTNDLYFYKDSEEGGDIFHLSKDNAKSYEKSEKLLLELLNKIAQD